MLLWYYQSTARELFIWRATFESVFLEDEFHTAFGWLVEHGLTWCVIFSGTAPLVAVLVSPSSSMAALRTLHMQRCHGKVTISTQKLVIADNRIS